MRNQFRLTLKALLVKRDIQRFAFLILMTSDTVGDDCRGSGEAMSPRHQEVCDSSAPMNPMTTFPPRLLSRAFAQASIAALKGKPITGNGLTKPA